MTADLASSNGEGSWKRMGVWGRRLPTLWLAVGLVLAWALVLPPLAGPGIFAAESGDETPCGTPSLGYDIVNSYRHDAAAFTQGLLVCDGALFESTGLYGRSTVREVDLVSGRVVRVRQVPPQFFGEGLACIGPRLYQLTWRSGVVFVYDKATLAELGRFPYEGEGWGLTTDGRWLIASDGTAALRFLDSETLREVRRITVRDCGREVDNLNELEFVKGNILANIWREDRVARISPDTGEVTGWLDLRGLRAAMIPERPGEVLNGIAYDPSGDRLFMTGKLWPRLFEIRLRPE